VSTVDSGNLLASLWVLEQGCREILNAPVVRPASLGGLADTLAVLKEELGRDRAFAEPVRELDTLLNSPGTIRNLRAAMPPVEKILDLLPQQGERFYWASCLSRELAAWIDAAERYPRHIPLRDLHHESETLARIEQLAAAARRFAEEINMRILYDRGRRLFGVGYAVGNPIEFTSHYDLLASECRLASLAAIAKGDVPRDHWNALGRPRAATHRPILLSWSGTMFEYLMPVLFTRSFIGSLLDRACQDAVAVQIAHGRREDLPWGVSECAFSAIDANRIYQYRAFGVPGLALKREVEDVAVVAPYATMLALQVTPTPSIENLRRLERMGLNGPMGFYEAVDFSRESKRGEAGLPIYAYMSHHQGMSLVAMDNALHQGPMQRRFHAELRVRAFESLLYERVPIHRLRAEEIVPRHAPVHTAPQDEPAEQIWKTIAPLPRVHLNGNGRYLLALTDSGTGFSRWNGFDVTRWRSDSANDFYGAFVYLRDVESSTVWSASRKPLGADWGTSWTTFSPDRATFFRRVSGIETRMQVTAAPEDDVEVRRITILNRSGRTREIELTSYMELALAPHRADSAHPAFSKMFIETECLRDGVLIAHRRLRSPDEPAIWVAHVLTGASGLIEFETDRAKFLGRGNTARNPAALNRDLSGEAGDVLDPIFSLRCRIALEGKQTAEVALYTIAASSRAALLPLIEKYARQEAAARTFEMAWTGLQLQLRFLGVRSGPVRRFQQLAGQLLYPNPSLRATRQRIARNRLGQSDLWGLGISGDLPMLAATISDRRDLAQIRELLLAHSYCRLLGFHFDLIVLNQEPPSYDGPLRQDLTRVVAAHAECVDCPGGVFIRDWSAISDAQRDLILASAAVVLHAARGPMEQQISAMPASKLPNEPKPPVATAATPLPELNLQFSNGFGGFTADEYVIDLKKGVKTPAPWVNVIANERFGTMLTERGLGCTWNVNSQTNRLTAWHNDPVSDPQAETITLRDQTSGAAWTVPSGEYRVRHGAGYSIFEQNCAGLAQRLTVFIPPSASIKVCRLELRNESAEIRSVKAAYSAELVLGTVREDQQLHIQTAFDEPSGARIAWQYWSATAAGWIAFLASEPRGESGAGEFDLNTARVDLAPGESKTITFLLGQAATLDAARQLIETHRHAEPDRLWGPLLTTLQVSTPLPSADLLLNRWLLYQALSCRFWGRTALYQSSGAFGFRDQLQDCLAFVYAAPQITRSHILACAARQFQEGDVQHWWHPDTGLGVRTRCSDDLLWLPYAAGRYIEITEDRSILAENAPFLEGAPLGDAETDRVFIARDSEETAPLIEHVRRALNRAYRLGEHGLPLIGTGDWNDGLNRVGIEGRGESVWLAWFVIATLRQWAKLDPAGPWADRAGQLAATVEKYCWDGGWYLRGFFDDGSPLGSHVNSEARIDSLPQSWAVISGAANPARARTAMDSAERHLVDERARIVKLFTPPFDHSTPHPGYIMGYPPGVRENGGQYTHGSLWLAMARARMGDGDRAVNLLQMMNPIEHSRDRDSAGRYAGEPYVSAADVYAAPGKEGRAGWTWYTGSAAWMYRIWIEEVLGFKLRGNRLTMQPSIPEDWPGFDITYRYGSATYEIRVEQRPGTAPGGGSIDLLDDGRVHRVLIVVSRKQQAAGTVEELQSVPRK
jgi:cyclic beta-1,2-glucan synthetase